MSWSALSLHAPVSSSLSATGALSVISVDPWTSGVNQSLSFPNAVDALISQAADHTGAGLAIAVASTNLTDFAGQLTALGSAFPMPSLSRLARRAAQLAELELTKMVLVPPGRFGSSLNLNALPSIRAIQRADLIKQAADDALAYATSDPIDNLTAFTADASTYADFVAGVQAAAAFGLTGGTGYRFYAGNNVASALKIGHPGHEMTLTAIQLFLGSAEDLALLAEIVQ